VDMSQRLKQFLLPPINEINNSSEKSDALKDFIHILLEKNNREEIIDYLDKNHIEFYQLLEELVDDKITNMSNKESLKERIIKEYNEFENLKKMIYVKKGKPEDIKEKFIELIDNLFDYENVMTGIYLYKSKNFDERIEKLDVKDFAKTRLIATIIFLIAFLIYLKDYEDKKVQLFLDIGIEYSEILESYADTLDILTNDE